ncbi:MAG: hypothetical protein ACJ77K_03965 [Bacteroidia bacterium]
MSTSQLKKRIRLWIILFIVFLVLSGVTAFPIETELNFVVQHSSGFPSSLQHWLLKILEEVKQTNSAYPHLAYGTDWLAFAHIVIATAFIGPYLDPVRNIWVIRFGMIACIMVFPLALLAGPFRQIPFFWQMIDCSFGVLGIIPLYICHKNILLLEQQNNQTGPAFNAGQN